MGANQNSLQELDLCPKLNPTPHSSNSAKTVYKLGQDRLAIDELLALETRLGIIAEIQIDADKNMCKIDDKN
jgi:hypothetical protein